MRGRTIVRRAEEPEFIGRFVVPENARADVEPGPGAWYRATVLAVGGDGPVTERWGDNERERVYYADHKVGDNVLVQCWSAESAEKYLGKRAVIVRHRDVMAWIDPESETESLVGRAKQEAFGTRQGKHAFRTKPDGVVTAHDMDPDEPQPIAVVDPVTGTTEWEMPE